MSIYVTPLLITHIAGSRIIGWLVNDVISCRSRGIFLSRTKETTSILSEIVSGILECKTHLLSSCLQILGLGDHILRILVSYPLSREVLYSCPPFNLSNPIYLKEGNKFLLKQKPFACKKSLDSSHPPHSHSRTSTSTSVLTCRADWTEEYYLQGLHTLWCVCRRFRGTDCTYLKVEQ
jgi:hypothetical protein